MQNRKKYQGNNIFLNLAIIRENFTIEFFMAMESDSLKIQNIMKGNG